MKAVVSSLITFVLLSVVHSQFLNCDWVLKRDCNLYADEDAECGSNGVTYDNVCHFAKAHCNDNALNLIHHGACLPSEVSTTANPVDGQTAVLDYFCTQLSHRDCDTDRDFVCGTDGFTYYNFCEYDKARCTHRSLHVAHFGPCV